MDLFDKYGVLTNRELEARVDVLYERYNAILAIEARTLVTMLKTKVIPAAQRAQHDLAGSTAPPRKSVSAGRSRRSRR